MTPGHPGPDLTVVAGSVLLLGALVGYAALVATSRRPWPGWRTVCWAAGGLVVGAGTVGPLAEAAHEDFTAHAVAHLAVGMLGPLLLVLGAPVTLALRTLPAPAARRLTRVLRCRPLRVLTEPVVAGLLDAGGLWLLYTTPVLAFAHHSPVLHLVVHAHLVLAAYLLTAVLVGPDPLPHRRSFPHRAAVLVAVLAAHDILAKVLWAHPPEGVADARTGALVMYYGGDGVELVVIVLLCARWYDAVRRGDRRATPSALASGRS